MIGLTATLVRVARFEVAGELTRLEARGTASFLQDKDPRISWRCSHFGAPMRRRRDVVERHATGDRAIELPAIASFASWRGLRHSWELAEMVRARWLLIKGEVPRVTR